MTATLLADAPAAPAADARTLNPTPRTVASAAGSNDAPPPYPPAATGRRRSESGRTAAVLAAAVLLGGLAGGAASRLADRPASGALPAAPAASSAAQTAPAAPAAASALQRDLVAAIRSVEPAVVSIRTSQGLGSGVIYDASGLILTNAHVVSGARTVQVRLADGRQLEGRILGADPGFDVAVVQVQGTNLPVARLGASASLQAGQFVAAIGNPYGLDHTVTTGVISATGRPVSEGSQSYAQPMIQTDTAINPGNSGGPLIDLQGNVVGITTLVAAPQGIPAQGLGFAVPVDTVQRIAPQLVQDGRVTRSGQPYLGLGLADLPGAQGGVQVGSVASGSTAGSAGVQVGDVITAIDGRTVLSRDDLLQALLSHKPGDVVKLTVQRAGQPLTLDVTLGEAPAR